MVSGGVHALGRPHVSEEGMNMSQRGTVGSNMEGTQKLLVSDICKMVLTGTKCKSSLDRPGLTLHKRGAYKVIFLSKYVLHTDFPLYSF